MLPFWRKLLKELIMKPNSLFREAVARVRMFRPNYLASLVFLLLLLAVRLARADVTFTELAFFNGTNGNAPQVSLTLGLDGKFYAPTVGDYPDNLGTIFCMTPSGPLSNLVVFTNYAADYNISSRLVPAGDGSFYGVAGSGGPYGYGGFFRMTSDGSLTNLLYFDGTNGASPNSLTLGQDGCFYGTTLGDTYSSIASTSFRVTTNGILTNLAVFSSTNGSPAEFPMVQTPDGIFYGVTVSGGPYANGPAYPSGGSIFRVSTNGSFTNYFPFNQTNGYRPQSGLTLGLDGNLYGATLLGGTNYNANLANVCGNIFRLTANGVITSIFDFNYTNGAWPNTRLVQASDGNFYGGTQHGGPAGNGGTIFCMTPEGALTTLYSFSGQGAGIGPIADMIQGSDGSFYGSYIFGGPSRHGSIFRLTVPSASLPNIHMTLQPSGALSLTWIPLPRRIYQVQFTTDSGSTNWTNLGDPIIATNSPMVIPVQPTGDVQRFFRITLLP